VAERCVNEKSETGFAPPPPPQAGEVERKLGWFREELRKLVVPCAPIRDIDFVNMYRGPKRRVYEQARLSLLREPLTAKDSEVDAFVKYEKIMKPDATPRAIFPRKPRFNISLGVWLRPIEEKMFDWIGELCGPNTVMKGLNVDDMGNAFRDKWNRFERPVAISLDAEKFDGHALEDVLKFKHSVQQLPYRSRELRRLQKRQLVNVIRAVCPDGYFVVKIVGRIMSGDIDTSMAAVILMCAMTASYCKWLGIKAEFGDNGDDIVVITERSNEKSFLADYEKFYRECGFKMALEGVAYRLEHIVFCQMSPIEITPGRYRMVRTLKRALIRDSACLKPLSNAKAMVTWLNAIGECGLALTSGIPIYQALYEHLRTVHGGSKKSRMKFDRDFDSKRAFSKGMVGKVVPVSDCARVSFWEAFGVDPTQQSILEQEVSQLSFNYDINVHLPNQIFDLL
jgi:hypothetical protein